MKNIKPTITVITPTYNRADLIKETIESVLNQSYDSFEYFILDDGSTDDTARVVEPYLKDKRVKYLWRANSGEAETANWGWNLANGKYFVQINSKDTAEPNLFLEMVYALENNKDAIVAYSAFNIINKEGQLILQNFNEPWNFIESLNNFKCTPSTPGTFLRRLALLHWNKIKDAKHKYISDVAMYFELALEGNFLYIPKFLSNWRQHTDHISADRYLCIPEYEEWFKYYFSKPNLPSNVLSCKDKSFKAMIDYFLILIKDSTLTNEEKEVKSYPYKQQLGHLKIANLQMGDNDLIGNKFNGHDLHLSLREKGIKSSHLVQNKESSDKDTFVYNFTGSHDFTKNILNNQLFLESDIIHLHLIHNTPFDLNYLPIMSRLKPMIWTAHDPWLLTGHCIYQNGCIRWEMGCGNCPYLNIPFYIPKDITALNYELKKQAIQNSSLSFIVASNLMKNMLESSAIMKGKKIYKIPFGIDQDYYKPVNITEAKKKFGIDKDSITLMFRTCRYNLVKGTDIIKAALTILKTNKKITLLTLQDTGLLENFKNKFNIIEFEWIKDPTLLKELYQACDIFLMPSTQESFGMMAIESMSCGKMVLAIQSKDSALPEVINSPHCGIAVATENYSSELQRLIDNMDEVRERGQKSLEFAKKHYNKEIYIKRITDAYQEVVLNHTMDNAAKYILEQQNKYAKEEPLLQFLPLFTLQPPLKATILIKFPRIIKIATLSYRIATKIIFIIIFPINKSKRYEYKMRLQKKLKGMIKAAIYG